MNWRGKPLVTHQAIVQLIAAATSRTGLEVRCELDPNAYPDGVKISDQEFNALSITRHDPRRLELHHHPKSPFSAALNSGRALSGPKYRRGGSDVAGACFSARRQRRKTRCEEKVKWARIREADRTVLRLEDDPFVEFRKGELDARSLEGREWSRRPGFRASMPRLSGRRPWR